MNKLEHSFTEWDCFLHYIAPIVGVILIWIIIWKWKDIRKHIFSKFSILTPLIDHIKKHPFGSTIIITFVIALILAAYSFDGRETVYYKSMIFELSKLVLSVILVTILLSANRFVPFIKQALIDFFTSKEFLDKLKSNELKALIDYINASTKNSYEIISNYQKEKSIELAKKQAIEENLPYFLRESKVTKAVYEKGLEMTVSESTIEMLKDGHFESEYAIETNSQTPSLPPLL
ncbi:hypothetical protein [Sulfurimonas sp.]